MKNVRECSFIHHVRFPSGSGATGDFGMQAVGKINKGKIMINSKKRSRSIRVLAPIAALALAAGACGSDDDAEPAADTAGATDTAADSGGDEPADEPAEEITLRMFDNETGELSPIWDEQIAAFEAANPGVTIERSSRSFDDYLDTVLLTLSGDDPPDIFQGNAGYTVDGPLIEAGLVLNLDPYEAQYGWNALFGESALQINSFSEDGLRWGDGPLFGLSPTNEIVGVYYNKTTAAELGIEVPPASFEDFEASLAVASDAGVQPILAGNSEQWPGGHLYNVVQNAIAPGQENFDWVLRSEGASYATQGNIDAAAKVQEWADADYINDDLNGLSYDDATAQYAEGEGLYFFTGSWMVGAFQDADIGFFAMPRVDGQAPAATGALSSPLHVSSSTDHADLAVEFIDFLTNAEAAATLAAAGQLPAATGVSTGEGTLAADVSAALGQVADGGVLVPYLDFAMSDPAPITTGLQEIFANRTSPEDYVNDVQSSYEEELAG